MRALSAAKLYGILDAGYCEEAGMSVMLDQMLRGGCDVIQLRAKEWPAERIFRVGQALHAQTLAAGVPLVINDHPQLAGAIGAEGAHVGQDDMTVAEARALAGPRVFIGKSSHSVAQALAVANEGADYLGFGPLFATPTKPDYVPIGTADIAEVHARIAAPIFCIGGIKLENITSVKAAGARRIVIVSGILGAPDPAAYAQACHAALLNDASAS
jgi:thiamine-phosphate pyrophosphorylase